MIIGIEFNIPNCYGNFLYKIFKNVNISNFEWEICFEEFLFYENKNLKNKFFDDAIISYKDFLNLIKREEYYMIFAELKAYFNGSFHEKVSSLKEFKKSNCQLVFLCSDSKFIEIYCKNIDILSNIKHNCISENFSNIKYIEYEQEKNRSLIM